jgi:hypothetical protein
MIVPHQPCGVLSSEIESPMLISERLDHQRYHPLTTPFSNGIIRPLQAKLYWHENDP